jgi:hypothetical protein
MEFCSPSGEEKNTGWSLFQVLLGWPCVTESCGHTGRAGGTLGDPQGDPQGQYDT